MNRIEAVLAPSKYIPEPHLAIYVDDTPLAELVGLPPQVSALLGWFHNDEDSKVPWERILPDIGCTGYAPILICPDHLDLDCNVVMVEVVAGVDEVRWERFGMDASNALPPVGSCIRWDIPLRPYCFCRVDYERCLGLFRDALGK